MQFFPVRVVALQVAQVTALKGFAKEVMIEKSALPPQLCTSREPGALWKAGNASYHRLIASGPCAALTGRETSLLLYSQLVERQELLQ